MFFSPPSLFICWSAAISRNLHITLWKISLFHKHHEFWQKRRNWNRNSNAVSYEMATSFAQKKWNTQHSILLVILKVVECSTLLRPQSNKKASKIFDQVLLSHCCAWICFLLEICRKIKQCKAGIQGKKKFLFISVNCCGVFK